MLKYIGNGHWLPGIPARDLTEDEVKRFGGKTKLKKTKLYADPPKQQNKADKEE